MQLPDKLNRILKANAIFKLADFQAYPVHTWELPVKVNDRSSQMQKIVIQMYRELLQVCPTIQQTGLGEVLIEQSISSDGGFSTAAVSIYFLKPFKFRKHHGTYQVSLE